MFFLSLISGGHVTFLTCPLEIITWQNVIGICFFVNQIGWQCLCHGFLNADVDESTVLELIQNYNMDYDQQINTDSLCNSVIILCSYSWVFFFLFVC